MDVRSAVVGVTAGLSLAVAPAALATSRGEIPARAVAAYVAAAAQSGCGVDWRDLAGIGLLETVHGSYGGSHIDEATGEVLPHIVGPALDGSGVGGNTEPWFDTDGGLLDGDKTYDRGVGPVGMMPETWRAYGQDVDGDGRMDPNDYDDAMGAAAALLCANGYASDRWSAVKAYNGSGPNATWYANEVDRYRAELSPQAPTVASSPVAGVPRRDGLAGRIADGVADRLLTAWAGLGRIVTGKPEQAPVAKLWASADRQVALIVGPTVSSASKAQPVPGVGGVMCPVPKPVVGDGWGVPRSGGYGHQGVDIGSADGAGSPLVAPFDAVVTQVVAEGEGGKLGNYVGLRRADGAEVLIGHNSANTVTAGQRVKAGEQVGRLGSSGNADAGYPHGHVQWYGPGDSVPSPATAIENACRTIETGATL